MRGEEMEKMEENEDIDKTIKILTEEIRPDPNNINTYAERAWLYLGNNDYNNAIADFTEVIRLDSCNIDAYYWRVYLYCDEDADKAIADLDEIIRIDPDNGHAYELLWQIHDGNGEYDKAITNLSELIRLKSNDSTPLVAITISELIRIEQKMIMLMPSRTIAG